MFPHGSKRDIIGVLEVADDVPLTFLSALNQWCELENKGEWIYQVTRYKNKSERKFTFNLVLS